MTEDDLTALQRRLGNLVCNELNRLGLLHIDFTLVVGDHESKNIGTVSNCPSPRSELLAAEMLQRGGNVVVMTGRDDGIDVPTQKAGGG